MKLNRRQLRRLINEEMQHMMSQMGDDGHHSGGCGQNKKTGKKCSDCAKQRPCGCSKQQPSHHVDYDRNPWATGEIAEPGMFMDEFPLPGDEAFGVGYETGKMGLGGDEQDPPHPQSYSAVMNFLQSNPDIVDVGIAKLMDMTGSTCPTSTRMAVSDYLMAES